MAMPAEKKNNTTRLLHRVVVLFLAFLIIANTEYAVGQPEIEIKNKKEKVSLELKDSSVILRIQSASAFTANVFTLENPARIVIDALGLKLQSQKSASPGKNKILKGFRLGFYPDKVRFVLDLNGKSLPSYSTSQEGNTFVLTIGGEDELMKLAPVETREEEPRVEASPTSTPEQKNETPLPEATATETPEPTPTEKPEEKTATPAPPTASPVVIQPSPTPTEIPPQPTATQTPLPVVQGFGSAAKEADVENELGNIIFDESGPESSLLRLILWKDAAFKLSKEKDYYTLSIPDCVPSGRHLILAHYPPENFTGINAVQVAFRKKETLLTIYVERGTRLSAYRNGSEIQVRAVVKSPL